MAPPRPPAGVIPARHPALARLWRSRRVRNVPFHHLRDLISVLYTVAPGVVEDPDFLHRSVLVDGVTPTTSPRDLLETFPLLPVQAAVLVRDNQTGYRVGLAVFSEAADSTSATNLTPPPVFYSTCIPASSHGDTRGYILDALEDESTRGPTAQLLRSLVPPQYILDDDDMEFHLRCVFLRGVAGTTAGGGGAYGLCRVARDVLLARDYLCAVVAWRDGDAGVLMYDHTEATEMLVRRAPHLLLGSKLQMLDSSVFPLPVADAGDREASLLRRLLPPYIRVAEEHYRCRVMLLTGLDTEHCDAAEIAYGLQHRLDLIYEHHELEAVVVHRSMGLVVVALRSTEDVEVILQEPPETWVLAFGRQVAWVSVFGGCPVVWPRSSSRPLGVDALQLQLNPIDWCNARALEYAREHINREMKGCRDHETSRIVRCLTELCVLSHPDVVQHGGLFSERALLLSGIDLDTSRSHLESRLLRFGMLDDLVFCPWRRLALAVFRSWTGAARLLREPAESWVCMGFNDCRRAPGAEDACITAEKVLRELLVIQGLGSPFMCP